MKIYDVIIIGSGPAGYTAATYASRGNLETLLLAGVVPGGQLMITTDVENYPGFPKGIMGPQLMAEMREQAVRFGTEVIDSQVIKVGFDKNPLEIHTEGIVYFAKTCIIATGASAKWLGLESEKRLMGKGISGCATCDGFFFKGKDLIVVGGGDSAMEESLFLTKFAKSIKIVVRKDRVRASGIMFDRAEKHPKIDFLYNTEVEKFIGAAQLNAVKIINNKSQQRGELAVQGAFIAIGHTPNTDIFKDHIELDQRGYIVRKNFSATSLKNVFVAGDVHDHRYKQAITAAGYGCEAAIDVMKYLEDIETGK